MLRKDESNKGLILRLPVNEVHGTPINLFGVKDAIKYLHLRFIWKGGSLQSQQECWKP